MANKTAHTINGISFFIKENSFVARIAAFNLKTDRVAIVFGNTIHLWNVSTQDFLKSKTWVAHELKHIEQYKREGSAGFLAKYVWESIRKGYRNNKFEVEAREAEL